jgi:hypothetical protein
MGTMQPVCEPQLLLLHHKVSSLCLASTLHSFAAFAGKLLGLNPWSDQAVELQRALTKAANTTVVLQPPAIETAAHILCVLQQAEADAARCSTAGQGSFISFDDTYAMYGYLIGHHMAGAWQRNSSDSLSQVV